MRGHLLALAVYAALATLFCLPVLGDPGHLALGHPGNDVWNHIWGYQWVADGLREGRIPTHTELLGWPEGGALWFIDVFGATLTAPLTWAFGPVYAYNAATWLNFFLCGLGAHLLAWQLTGSRLAALSAGFAYATTPQLLGQAYNGISETLAAGWLPLAVAAIRAAALAPSARSGALAGLAWAVAVIANWYYGLFTVAFGLALAGPARAAPRRRLAEAAVAGAACFLLLAAPPFWLFNQTMLADDALVSRDPGFTWRTLLLHNMTDLVALFHPGRFYSPDLKAVFGEDLIVVVYVGHALLWPALAAIALARPRGVVRPWILLVGVFFLFTLGPYLYAGGDYVEVAGGWIPLPFLAFFKFFPMFSRISHAYRFAIGLSLALAMLLAWFIRAAQQRRWQARALAAGIGAARLVETTLLSSAVFPLPVAEVRPAEVLAGLEGGAVLDLPVGVPVLGRSRYLAGQLLHRLPTPYGLNDPTPPFLYYNRYSQYILALERTTVTELPARMPWLDLELGRAALVDEGLRWIVVHRESYPASQLPKLQAFLDLTATPVHRGEELLIYRLDPEISAATASAAASPTATLPAAVR